MIEFNFQDAFPLSPLNEIHPISVRAQSWLSRASKISNFLGKPQTQILGGVLFLSGLDYHHDQFLKHYKNLKPYYLRKKRFMEQMCKAGSSELSPLPSHIEKNHLDAMHHEAVAYINRLGQFMYFAKAMKLDAICLRGKELLSFRNKHTAHRSIDDPRGESLDVKEMQAMAFNFYQLNDGSFPIFQIQQAGQIVNFHMRDDHVVVMKEAMALLETLTAISEM
jgi:hypothetical protein